MQDNITAIELFAGAGGLALGLEQAGINALAYVEYDKNCCETLKCNRPKWNVICTDVSNVDFTKYRGVDIVSGGFPCQAFSYAGKKLGFSDTRGTLFYEFARCVKETTPKLLLAENVKGLLAHDKGHTFGVIKDILESLGYTLQYKVLNAAYYGVGQKRERLIIVGARKDLNIDFSFPEPDSEETTLRKALENCPASEGIRYSEKKRKVLELVPAGGCWTALPPRCHPDETRPLTVREYARVQSFPDDWNFCGSIAAKYKQIGNAVPVELARRIGVQLVVAISEVR